LVDFNPNNPQGNDDMPSYLRGYSEPISNVEANKSSGIALNTLGTAIEGGASLVSDVAKEWVSKDVRDTVEPIRNDFTHQLELARDAQTSGADLPTAVNTGLDKVDALHSALANGKINDTYYDLNLKSAVTNLRAKYPGYVDLIDQRVSAITGVNPANAYVNNLMQDLNRQVSAKKTEQDKVLDIARKAMENGTAPGSEAQYYRLLQDPTYAPKFLDWYTRATENKTKIETDNAQRANRKASREESSADDEQKFTNLIGMNIQTALHSAVSIPGTDTPQGIMDFMQAVAAHPEKYSSTMMETLATQLKLQKTSLQAQLTSLSNQTSKGPNGEDIPSYAQSIGVSKRDDIIKSQLAVYDSMYDAIKGGGPAGAGLAYYHANQAIARLNDRKDNISAGPIGQDLDNMQIIQEKAGPAFSGILIPQLLQTNIDDKMRPYFNSKKEEALAQPDFDSSGRPITMKQHLEQADALQKNGQITQDMKARYTGNLVNIVDDLKNPQYPDSIKTNIARYIFSPEGQGILSHIKTDYYDPDKKVNVPGKYSVFNRLTSDDVISQISHLAKSDPQIGTMYKQYLENEAGSQLFYKELQNLNHFTGHDDLHFRYVNSQEGGSPHIELLDNKGALINPVGQSVAPPQYGIPTRTAGATDKNVPPPQSYIWQVQKIVNRVNDGLAGLGRVEKGMGGDVDDYLLRFMMHAQVNLGQNWTGLTQKIGDAVAASRSPQRKVEDTFDSMKK
jgi:hypothetical protein